MRALTTVAAILLAGAALTSCDMPGSGQKEAAVAPCNCTPTPPPTMVAPSSPTEHLTRLSYVPRHRYHRRHFYRSGAVRYNRDANAVAERSVDAYDYVSTSRVSERSYSSASYSSGYASSGESGYGESSYGENAYGGERGYRAGGRIAWVDGYGRGYYAGQRPTVAATMRGERLTNPYHGYLTDCPDNGWH